MVTKARGTLTRKLRLAPNDKGMHEPLALAEQAEYFTGNQKEDTRCRWLSVFLPFIAMDVVASHVAPEMARSVISSQENVPFQKVPLDRKVVNVR